MPFAGFKDFAACVAAQRKRGKSASSAKKICGALQARAEGKKESDSKMTEEKGKFQLMLEKEIAREKAAQEVEESEEISLKEVAPISYEESLKESAPSDSIIIEGVAVRSGVTSGNGYRYPLSELKKQDLTGVKIFMDHISEASNVVGKIVESTVVGRNLKFKAKLINTQRNPEIVKLVKEGLIDAVSIGGDGKVVKKKVSEGGVSKEIRDLSIKELSLVGLAGIPQAKIDNVTEGV